jgi:HD-like signal output (HDOD) protein/CheY-like chemotaxis protein
MPDRPRLLFVDDDPRILQGIENLLFDKADLWDMAFTNSGGDAIVRMERGERIDILVTDMRMPGVDGLQVLRYAAAHRPQTMRVVLSGHAEMTQSMQAVTLGHQYLAKPCNERDLLATIHRALHIKQVIADDQLRCTIGALDAAPPNHDALEQLRALLRSPRVSIGAIATAVSRDVGLATRLLQVANSCIYVGARVSSVAGAVQRIGLEGVGALATAFALYGQFTIDDPGLFAQANDHAMLVGQIAVALCSRPEDTERAFLCGLLHGLGTVALAAHAGERLHRARLDLSPDQSKTIGERREFGIDHAWLGAEILDLWQMTELADVVRYHHQPSAVEEPRGHLTVLASLHLADAATDGGARELDRAFMNELGSLGETAWMRARHLAGGAS